MNDTAQRLGTVIADKYRLEETIGEGGMGAVYRATQLAVDRPVALKLLHSGLRNYGRLKQRFAVEAKAIGRLHHPNCITLYDFGHSDELNSFYMVMEFLEGTPLHERVFEGVTPREALEITRQISMALDHAHHKGILHRDLKPENIFLAEMTDGSELVKVLDFGIARLFADKENDERTPDELNRITEAGEIFGTPAYISPEQARSERDLTPAADIYSLGVMLFEMIEQRLPYFGATAIETIMKHLTEPIPKMTRIDVPSRLRHLVYQMLAKEAEERPQSGKELLAILDELIAEMEHQSAADAYFGTQDTSPDLSSENRVTVHAQGGEDQARDDTLMSHASKPLAHRDTMDTTTEYLPRQREAGTSTDGNKLHKTTAEMPGSELYSPQQDARNRALFAGLAVFVILILIGIAGSSLIDKGQSRITEPAETTNTTQSTAIKKAIPPVSENTKPDPEEPDVDAASTTVEAAPELDEELGDSGTEGQEEETSATAEKTMPSVKKTRRKRRSKPRKDETPSPSKDDPTEVEAPSEEEPKKRPNKLKLDDDPDQPTEKTSRPNKLSL